MTDGKKRKKGGGKLTRSETVTVRLDPRLRYLSELAARSQRRTLSSYIEWTLQQSLDDVVPKNFSWEEDITLAERAEYLWHVEPADRLVRLAFQHSHLLNFEEANQWHVIMITDWFWDSDLLPESAQKILSRPLKADKTKGRTFIADKTGIVSLPAARWNRIRRAWGAIKSRANKEMSQDEFYDLIKGYEESGNG